MVKVAFIVCYNNTLYMKECMDYISWLNVPEGVETEIIGITDAESMAAGYNAAKNSSDAKYKVYLHQDVFILNKDFIRNIIDIFINYPDYGMLGVIGSNRIITDAEYWDKWNVGITYAWDGRNMSLLPFGEVKGSVECVKAIDGMIMITQYDIPWRQDIFDGFDFYDLSQSTEFLRAGYKVGVVNQKQPWCLHDCGASKLSKYDIYRKRFCETYEELGYHYTVSPQLENRKKKNEVIENLLPEIAKALELESFDYVIASITTSIKYFPFNTKLQNIYVITELILEEKRHQITCGFYKKGVPLNVLLEKYMLYRFLLNRFEYDKSIESLKDVLAMIAESDDRLVAERVIATHTVLEVEKVIGKLRDCISSENI